MQARRICVRSFGGSRRSRRRRERRSYGGGSSIRYEVTQRSIEPISCMLWPQYVLRLYQKIGAMTEVAFIGR